MVIQGWYLKTFNELNNAELYNLLRLRNSVFIIDQRCVFEEIDGRDIHNCHHLFYRADNMVIAYARIFSPGMIYEEPCLSRFCTDLKFRGKGIGKELMRRALGKINCLYPGRSTRIGAQIYLKKFYDGFGFKEIGDCYIEDGINHIQMIREFVPT